MTFRLICFAFSLLLCRAATAQIVYDGFEQIECEIYFSHAGVRDGEFKLLFDSKIDRDSPVVRWIRPGSHYLGWRVTFEENNGRQEAVFNQTSVFSSQSPFRLPLWGKDRHAILRGTFSHEGRGDKLVTAHTGDSFTIGGISATVVSLDRFKAELQLSSTGEISTFAISSTGELRSQQFLLKEALHRLKVEQDDLRFSRKCLLYFGGTSIFLLLVYGLFYFFVFIGKRLTKLKPRTLGAKAGK